MLENQKIILFDGVCNLCNGAVNFVIQRDKRNIFKFAALQSGIAKKLLNDHVKCKELVHIQNSNLSTIILIDGDNCYSKSTAALHIAKNLSGIYPLLYLFMILPKFIRNGMYDYVARNRYKWFGKKESCMIPSSGVEKKFL